MRPKQTICGGAIIPPNSMEALSELVEDGMFNRHSNTLESYPVEINQHRQKIKDVERQLEEMKTDFARSKKNHAFFIGKLDQKDMELSTGALSLLQEIVERQSTMINMLQQKNNNEQFDSSYDNKIFNVNDCSNSDA
ncbi:hypothetical protein SADUNF_Sadunf14G0030400 [Salix dunnii]|uniref:Uncharacterized protein n=1 Tax=Salix dunnii TaxID=1413687 RepID=A0A835JFY6_9ROSI|nr:hypothetical protein SADUNF_Sadunf14G0030400 [Salix dunnii]